MHASVFGPRVMFPVESRSRRRCHCGCKKRATHTGRNNGIALVTGCELYIRRWAVRRLVAMRGTNEPDCGNERRIAVKCDQMVAPGPGRAKPCTNEAKFLVTGYAGTKLHYCGVHARGMKERDPKRVEALAPALETACDPFLEGIMNRKGEQG